MLQAVRSRDQPGRRVGATGGSWIQFALEEVPVTVRGVGSTSGDLVLRVAATKARNPGTTAKAPNLSEATVWTATGEGYGCEF